MPEAELDVTSDLVAEPGLSLLANSDDNPMLAAIGSYALEQVERG